MRNNLTYLTRLEWSRNTLLRLKTLTHQLTTSKPNSTLKSLPSKVLSKNTNLLKLETLPYKMKSTDSKLIRLDLKLLFYLKKPLLNLLVKTLMLLNKIESTLLTLPIFKTCKPKTFIIVFNTVWWLDHNWVMVTTITSECDQDLFIINFINS